MAGKSDHLLEDAMIAATARVRGLVVVTRNLRDFETFRVDVLNPFKSVGGFRSVGQKRSLPVENRGSPHLAKTSEMWATRSLVASTE
jgi:hypothetical protein